MARRAAIRGEGDEAERRFIELVPSARDSDHARLGDAIVTVDGSDSYIEIKECHAAVGRSGTINQVRQIKYICCIVWAPNHGCWYVISPDQLVALAARKARGQHTEVSFESMNFGLRSLPDELHTRCDDAGLAQAVHSAIRRGRERNDVRELMASLLEELQGMQTRTRERVAELLSDD